MTDIYHQVGVKADVRSAYSALTTLEGLSGWWTTTTGKTETDGILYFHFGDNTIQMTVVELIIDKKIVWLCSEKEGEWKDTSITFDLVESDEQVFINFSHSNWKKQTELCAHCCTKWAVFMLSLKDYLEKGQGHPFPNDVQINHIDF